MLSIIAISRRGEGYEFADKLAKEGHIVKFYTQEKRDTKTKENKNPKLIEKLDDHIESADLFLFCSSGFGTLADTLGKAGKVVIGGGVFQDIIEKGFKERLFSLMPRYEVKDGFYIALEGWFNGKEWIKPFSFTMCNYRLMENDKGPTTTGVGFVTEFCEGRVFDETLMSLTKILVRETFVGPLTILGLIGVEGFVPLEIISTLTPSTLNMLECFKLGFGDFLFNIEEREELALKGTMAMATMLSSPPFPYEMVTNKNGFLDVDKEAGKHFYQSLPGSSVLGFVTARGVDVTEARRRVYRTIGNIVKSQDVQYREDIGKSKAFYFDSISETLEKWRWKHAINGRA
jgi:hypothetical protein